MNIYQPTPLTGGDCDLDAIGAAHDPNREPWASMSLEGLHEPPRNAKMRTEDETINQFILDRASTRQLETIDHARPHLLRSSLRNTSSSEMTGAATCARSLDA